MRKAGLLIIAVVAIALAGTASAQDPYEPNDSLPGAAGPLEAGSVYAGAIETTTDRDFFSFYVTAPGGAEASLTIANQGGGQGATDLELRILDPLGTPLGSGVSFLRQGESRAAAVTLPPGRYIVEVSANEGVGDRYLLVPGGSEGAFGGYARIAARCATATAAANRAAIVLRRTESRLQRARARYRRSIYLDPAGRRAARASLVAAKSRLRRARDQSRTAASGREPWCSIPG